MARRSVGRQDIDAPANSPECKARDALAAHLMGMIGKLHDLVAGIDDPALYVFAPDSIDRAMLVAGARLAEFEERAEDAALCRRMVAETATVFTFVRTELMQILSRSWPPDALEFMASPPPPGALPIAYDGTACGHGVLLLMPAGIVVHGGSA